MPRPSFFFLVSFLFLEALSCAVQAQQVERVVLYRDAAVVTWKAEAKPGEQVLARSFSPMEASLVAVMPEKAGAPLGMAQERESEWPMAGAAGAGAARDRVDALRLDVALKQAQLDIIEEDLAMLRANRSVGGTSESLLVEDLEEMAEWMHDAFREALYRRVELREELTALEEEHRDALAVLGETRPRTAFEWVVEVPEGAGGVILTDVVETHGAGWSPADLVDLTSDGSPSTWHRRIEYRLSLPHTGEADVLFVDEWWFSVGSAENTLPDAVASYDLPRGKLKRSGSGGSIAGSAGEENEGRSRCRPEGPLDVGANAGGVVKVGEWTASFFRQAVTRPRVAAVVDVWHSTASAGRSVVRGDGVKVRLDGETLGLRNVVHEADSLLVLTGVDEAWTVSRAEEASLCSRSNLGSRIRHHRAFSIHVTNGRPVSGSIRVVEPLPRSRELEIELNPEELDGGVVDSVNEAIVWELDLKPGESRTLRFSYSVEHDRDVRVSGFN